MLLNRRIAHNPALRHRSGRPAVSGERLGMNRVGQNCNPPLFWVVERVCELQEPEMIRVAGLQRADQRLKFREFA